MTGPNVLPTGLGAVILMARGDVPLSIGEGWMVAALLGEGTPPAIVVAAVNR